MDIKEILNKSKRIVFKIGTNVLTSNRGNLSLSTIYAFIEDIAELHEHGKEIIIVTSGSIGIGKKKLKMLSSLDNIPLKQACAAVGQGQLMYIYEEGFEKFDILTAQVLLTEDDFSQRQKYLSLRNTLNELLKYNVIPIINQNDTVSTNFTDPNMIASFGDNDKLSALVASKLDADLMVILSDIDGLFDKNPKKNTDAKLIPLVEEITPEIESLGFEASENGRGGMKTKLEAAKVVTHSGHYAMIINGDKNHIVRETFHGNFVGTLFLPVENLSGRKRWIAYATNITGGLKVNSGAKKALVEKFSSLLPIGVISVINRFQSGDVISILDEDENEFARGIVNFSDKDCKKIIGKHSEEIEHILGTTNYDTVISRDNIAIL